MGWSRYSGLRVLDLSQVDPSSAALLEHVTDSTAVINDFSSILELAESSMKLKVCRNNVNFAPW